MSSKISNRLQQIKIKIKYNSKCFNIDVQPYKTIKYVKDQAKKYFYPITNLNISLHYQNKDLSQYESILMGEYFKNKSTVCLRLHPSITPYSFSEKKLHLTENNNNKLSYQQYTCYCDKEEIAYYCRSCYNFICNSCKMNEKHLNHYTIHVDVNKMEDSIRLYALTLQNDIHTNVESMKEYNSNNNNMYCNENMSSHIKINKREETFLKKMTEIMALYQEMNSILSNYANNIQTQYDNVIQDFDKTAKEAIDHLEQFIVDFYAKQTQRKNRISYKEMISLFNFIQRKENEYNEMAKDALAFKINYELDTNLTIMYDRLNETVNEYFNNSTNPFGLNMYSYHIYSLIKSNSNSSNDNRRAGTNGANVVKSNGHSSIKKEGSKCCITSVDKDQRSKSTDKKKINFNPNLETFSNNENQYQFQVRRMGEITFAKKETMKISKMSRAYTRDSNSNYHNNMTEFFEREKDRTPIKFMTGKLNVKNKMLTVLSNKKGDNDSIDDLILDNKNDNNINQSKRKKIISISNVPKMDQIFDNK